jgi:hypothetical protein
VKKLLFAISALVVLGLVGCSDSDPHRVDRPARAIDQKYLFDIYSVNFSWGYHLVGTFIDDQGHVVRYDHSFERWEAEDFGNLAEAELDEKFISPQDTLAVIDPATLLDKFQKIRAAGRGELSERVQSGYDMGGSSYVCYWYDEEQERYVRVLLSLTGDFTQTNLSDEAIELTNWLRSVLNPDDDEDRPNP